MGAIAVAVLALFLVVRHTRAEEETGRLELLGATVVGRRAPLTAALVVAGGASLAAGAATALGLLAVGMPAAGSLLMGAGFACLGIAFAAVAGVTAQLVEERADRRRPRRRRPRRLLPAARGRRRLGRERARLALVALAGRLVAADPALRRRPLVGARPAPRRRGRGRRARLRARGAPRLRRGPAAGPAGAAPRPPRACGARAALAWRLQRGSFFAWAAAFAVAGLRGRRPGHQRRRLPQEPAGSGAHHQARRREGPQRRLPRHGARLRRRVRRRVRRAGGDAPALGGVRAARRAGARHRGGTRRVGLEPPGRSPWLGPRRSSSSSASARDWPCAVQAGDGAQVGRVVAGALVQIPAVWVVVGVVAAAFGLVPAAGRPRLGRAARRSCCSASSARCSS